jgi:hypothetical protein
MNRGAVGADVWQRVVVRRIEELADAVLDAGLEATQMAGGTVTGSLVFAVRDGITYSGGYIASRH